MQQKNLVSKISETYINATVQNSEDRFENHMDALVPATIASQSSNGNFGVDAVCSLATNFNQQVTHLDVDQCLSEYKTIYRIYFIPSSESSAYLKQIKCILSAVKKYRIFSLVTDTIFIFSL